MVEISLPGKVAIITGAARGMGKSIALRLAEAGCRGVVVNYLRNQQAAEETAQELRDRGAEPLLVQGDVGEEDDARALVERAYQQFGRVDILVNNAGICPRGDFFDTPVEDFDAAYKICLRSTFLCTQAVVPIMKEQGSGHIVNISSTSGLTGGTMGPAYGAAKAGVIALTKYSARTLTQHGIRVNCIAPGYVETDLYYQANYDPEVRQKRLKDIPLGRIGRPEEIADIVLFLVSDMSSYVIGDIILASGGRTN